jgi:hypothetical protein
MVNARTAELSYTIALELNYSPSTADVAGSSDLPYSGGAHGPSPFATLFAISSYHCSFVLPCRRPMTIIVMLSQPTPPVSLFEARQLSIMFSQIDARSCFATIPRLTNSITAWEDWQSQIPLLWSAKVRDCRGGIASPSQATTRNSSSWLMSCISTSGKAVTICCSGGRSALFLNSKSPIARDRARLPFTRPKSTKPPAAWIRAFSAVTC